MLERSNYILIAESEEGQYEPIGEAVTCDEAQELAASDMARRKREQEDGNTPMCAYLYNLWGRCADGGYVIAADPIMGDEL